MRRLYRKPYYKAPKPKTRRSTPLMQPEWDDTIHDLTQLRLSPEEQLRRRVQRISKNQWGFNILAKQLSAADADQGAETDRSRLQDNEAEDSTLQHLGQPLQSPRSYTTDSSDSEEDMCQYHQPRHTCPWNTLSSRPEDDDSDQRKGRAVSTASVAVKQQQRQHGTALLVDAGLLQALLGKIETLEAQLMQQQQQPPPMPQQVGDWSEHVAEADTGDVGDEGQHCTRHVMQQQYQQQSATDVLLQQQLAAGQQQRSGLQEASQQHMPHSSTSITSLQAQLQQLLLQSTNGMSPGAMSPLGADSYSCSKVAPNTLQQEPAFAAGQMPRQQVNGVAGHGDADTSAAGLSSALFYRSTSSGNNNSTSSSSSRSPIKSRHGLLAPAAVASTGSPHKSTPTSAPNATSGHQAAALHQYSALPAGVMSSGAPGAAAAVAEETRLPTYLQMRQRTSLQQSSIAAAIGAGTGLADRTRVAAANVLHGGAGAAGTSTATNYGSKSQGNVSWLHSRPVPPPLPADNPAAAFAAGLSGDSVEQGLCTGSAAPGQLERWSNARQVAPVMSCSQAKRLSALSTSVGIENDLPGQAAVDYGLQEGLPRSAVGRIFTAAGCTESVEVPPEPRAVLEQLKGNVSLNDHIRAVAALKGGATSAVGATAWWRM